MDEANAEGRSTFASLACNAPGGGVTWQLAFLPSLTLQAGVSNVLTCTGPLLDCERWADLRGCDQRGRCGRRRPHPPFRTCAVIWMTSSSGGRCVAFEREQSFNPLCMTTMGGPSCARSGGRREVAVGAWPAAVMQAHLQAAGWTW